MNVECGTCAGYGWIEEEDARKAGLEWLVDGRTDICPTCKGSGVWTPDDEPPRPVDKRRSASWWAGLTAGLAFQTFMFVLGLAAVLALVVGGAALAHRVFGWTLNG